MIPILRFSLAPMLFCGLSACIAHWLQPPSSIEFSSLLFFAMIAPLTVCLEYADAKVSESGSASPAFTYVSLDHAATLSFLAILAGGLLATGGGILRRTIELGSFFALSALGVPFRPCYAPASGAMWPIADKNWLAVGYGISIGLAIGMLLTIKVRADQNSLPTLKRIVMRETAAVDGFGTAFFAAFGMEAAIRFIGGLPLGSAESIPSSLYSAAHVITFYLVTPAIVLFFSALTSCGGGLLKDIVIDGFALRKFSTIAHLLEWPYKATTQCAAGIGLTGYVGYLLASSRGLNELGSCQQIGPEYISFIILMSGLVGLAIWSGIYRDRV